MDNKKYVNISWEEKELSCLREVGVSTSKNSYMGEESSDGSEFGREREFQSF